jgi:hypothetical protein
VPLSHNIEFSRPQARLKRVATFTAFEPPWRVARNRRIRATPAIGKERLQALLSNPQQIECVGPHSSSAGTIGIKKALGSRTQHLDYLFYQM